MLTVQEFPVDDLNLFHKNPRQGDITAIAESLAVRGQYRPIVVNEGTLTGRPLEVLAGNHTLLAGNHTLLAAIQLGWTTIQATTVESSGRLGRGSENWQGDNKQSTVFEVPKPSRNAQHPTMKPVELILAMLENSLRTGGLVIDPFGGSGSTLIAAHHHGSRAALIELDPRYVDVICRRYQNHTGILPKRSGETVDFLTD